MDDEVRKPRTPRRRRRVAELCGEDRLRERVSALHQLVADSMNAVNRLNRRASELNTGAVPALRSLLPDESLQDLLNAAEQYRERETYRRQDRDMSQRFVRKAWLLALGREKPRETIRYVKWLKTLYEDDSTTPEESALEYELRRRRRNTDDATVVKRIYNIIADGTRCAFPPDAERRGKARGELGILIDRIGEKLKP